MLNRVRVLLVLVCMVVFSVCSMTIVSCAENVDSANSARSDSLFVIGFVPYYKELPSDSVLKKYTHLIYFSLLPSENGTIDSSDVDGKTLALLRENTSAVGSKLLISIGGFDRSANFASSTADSSIRAQLSNHIAQYLDSHRLDGVDLDWEYPQSLEERKNYGAFIKALRNRLGSQKLITVNMHRVTNYMQGVDPNDLSWVQIMSYDQSKGVKFDSLNPVNPGPFTSLGQNGRYEESLEQLAFWKSQGFKASQIVLGVPFYGRTLADGVNPPTTEEYKMLKPVGDDVDTAQGYFFNGKNTMRKKVHALFDGGYRGLMVWEVTQDAEGAGSLLSAIIGTRDSLLKK